MPASRSAVAPLILPFPLLRSQCGFPLGNGMFGALVWGQEDRLCVTINRSDFWDHRAGEMVPGENLYEELKRLYDPLDAGAMNPPFEPVGQARPPGAFRNTRLPMGRFEWELKAGVRWREGRLFLETGRLELWWEDVAAAREGCLEVALHPRQSALWICDRGAVLQSPGMRPAWEWVSEPMLSRGFEPPKMRNEHDRTGWIQTCPEDPAMAAMCAARANGFVVVMTPGVGPEEAWSEAGSLLDGMDSTQEAVFFQETTTWWGEFWKDVPEVSLPDPFFDQYLRFALFKFAGATSPESDLPSGLQGPWCEEYQMPAWSADYHFNVNIQQIYTLAFPCGKTEHLLPLFDMLERSQDVFREQARRMVGISDGLLMNHTTDDRGYACGGVGPGACIDQAVSGWTAQLYWLYFQHTGERDFLRDRALPFMKGVMRVFEEMLEWKDGVPSLPISISAEYGQPLPDGTRQRVGPDASYQLACMHMLLEAIFEASRILEEPVPASWVKIKKRLPRWSLVGEKNRERIAIWRGLDLEISHRHHSHLACVYPFDTLSELRPPEEAILERSLNRWLEVGMSDWSEWCFPWAAMIQAREGYRESPLRLLELGMEIFMNEGLSHGYIPNFPGITLHGFKHLKGTREECEIMQLDGTMGTATALYEMLVHRHRGTVRFFPAIPEKWRDASFHNIHLPGLLLAGGEKRNGKVTRVVLQSMAGGPVRLDVPGYSALRLKRGQRIEEVTLPCEVDFQPGETVEGEPVKSGDRRSL